MRAGKLDRTIVIKTVSAGTPNASGTSSQTTTTFATVRAEFVQGGTEEFLRGYGETNALAVIFRIRWLAGVTTDHLVEYQGKNLNIREIKEIGRRRGLELRCEEVRK